MRAGSCVGNAREITSSLWMLVLLLCDEPRESDDLCIDPFRPNTSAIAAVLSHLADLVAVCCRSRVKRVCLRAVKLHVQVW